MMNISNCKEGQVVEINIGGEILRTKVTPNVKSNIIHTEAYLRVMDQLSDYLKNNPGIHQMRTWLNEMKTRVVETAKRQSKGEGSFSNSGFARGSVNLDEGDGLGPRDIQAQAPTCTIEVGSKLFKSTNF